MLNDYGGIRRVSFKDTITNRRSGARRCRLAKEDAARVTAVVVKESAVLDDRLCVGTPECTTGSRSHIAREDAVSNGRIMVIDPERVCQLIR